MTFTLGLASGHGQQWGVNWGAPFGGNNLAPFTISPNAYADQDQQDPEERPRATAAFGP